MIIQSLQFLILLASERGTAWVGFLIAQYAWWQKRLDSYYANAIQMFYNEPLKDCDHLEAKVTFEKNRHSNIKLTFLKGMIWTYAHSDLSHGY